ncbi:MAG: hypothetical protein KA716_11525 [Gloeotrichia echinulata DEX184]|nr:hypothetical protein [Gloeotrichia echinulata DEX184]
MPTAYLDSLKNLIWTVVHLMPTAYLDSLKNLIWTVVHLMPTAYLDSLKNLIWTVVHLSLNSLPWNYFLPSNKNPWRID